VGGKAAIEGELKARTVRVGGKVEAYKIEALDEIATNTLRTRKGAKAEEIEIGRRGEAEGPLIANRILIRERARVEELYGGTVTLRKGSRADNVYAENLTIENDCRINGDVKYTNTDSLRYLHGYA
jgi:cytoskeletal protein CcmA (bactofilin family)